ncbi:MAG TPA: hypothetical protein VF441_02720 [Acidimicrobiia bacterium]
MASGLQCPACGHKHRVSTLPEAEAFRCEECGQMLKIPTALRPQIAASAGAGSGQSAAEPDATVRVPEIPRESAVPAAATPQQTSVLPVSKTPAPVQSAPPPPTSGGKIVSLPVRLMAWIIGMVVGGIFVVAVARKSRFLSGQRVIDIVTGNGWARYGRLAVVALAWGLVSAVLVHLLVEGGRAFAARRRLQHAQSTSGRSAPPSRGGESTDLGDASVSERRARLREAARQREGREPTRRGGS